MYSKNNDKGFSSYLLTVLTNGYLPSKLQERIQTYSTVLRTLCYSALRDRIE